MELIVEAMIFVVLQTGEICLDILKNAWSPAWTLQSVCRAIIALMAHPEADSPLNCDSGIFPKIPSQTTHIWPPHGIFW